MYSDLVLNNNTWRILTLDYNGINKLVIKSGNLGNGNLLDYNLDKNVCFLDRVDNEDLYDFHLSIGSLGKFFRNAKQDFLKQKIPLLISDKEYTEVLKNKINSTCAICTI